MPRDGSGIFSIPPGTDAIPDQTIESTKYNGFTHDVEQDLNAARPIVAGGTGATSAHDARFTLGCEVASQIVTNYDSQVWENGSFHSDFGATSAPLPAANFTGYCVIGFDTGYIDLVAMDNATGATYVRRKVAGSWSGWSGGAFGGTLTITTATYPALVLNSATIGGTTPTSNYVVGQRNGANRWAVVLGGGDLDGPSNFGSDFFIGRYANDSSFIDSPLFIKRDTGAVTISAPVTVNPSGSTAATPNNAVLAVGYSFVGQSFRPNLDGQFPLAFANAAGVNVGTIQTTATATAYNTASSAELKEDLKSFDAGRIVDDTTVYNFAWKQSAEQIAAGEPVERAYGVIAQQANEVYPEAVTYIKETGWYGIDYSKYVPVLLQELKALRARVAQLEAGLAAKPA